MTATRDYDLWGVPFDGASTLGWPGSRYAPARIRAALAWMLMRVQDGQIYSNDLGRVLNVPDGSFRDRGDAAVVAHDLMASLDGCSAAVADSIRDGRIPVVLGGDDSLLFACVRGFHDQHEGPIAIVHCDAHLDLLDENEQQGRFSQSSGMRRALELPRVSAAHSIQVGVRNFNFAASRRVIEDVGLDQLPATEFDALGTDGAAQRIKDRVAGCEHVFLAFDIDVLDPAFAPGAGAHEPGGLTARQALDLVRAVAPLCGGMSMVEVNPLRDLNDVTASLAANLVFAFVVAGLNGGERGPSAG